MTTFTMINLFLTANYENLNNSLYGQHFRTNGVMQQVIPFFLIIVGVVIFVNVFLTHSTTKSSNSIKQYEAEIRSVENESKLKIAQLEAETKLAEANIRANSEFERTVVPNADTSELLAAAKRILLAHNYDVTTAQPIKKETSSSRIPAIIDEDSEESMADIDALALALLEISAKDKQTVQTLINDETNKN